MNRLLQILWIRVPIRVAHRWPLLGIILADGHYLVRWLPVAVIAPPAALLAGALIAGIQRLASERYDLVVYMTSVIVIAFFVMLGQFGAAIGLWSSTGYVVASGIINLGSLRSTDALSLVGLIAGSLEVALVLVIASCVIPVVVGGMRASARRLSGTIVRWLEPIGAFVVAAMALWGWTSSAPLLVRPLYVWTVGSPTYAAVAPLQQWGLVVVLLGAAAAAGRVLVDRIALVGPAAWFSQIVVAGLSHEAADHVASARHVLFRAAASGVGVTFLLAGLISNWFEALATAVFLSVVLLARNFLRDSPPGALRWLFIIPRVLRLLVALICTWVVCQFIIGTLWYSTQSFLPVLVAACIGAAITTLITTDTTITVPRKEEVSK